MKRLIFVFAALVSFSAYADSYDCSLSLTPKNGAKKVIKKMTLQVDGFGEMVSIPREDVLDIRLFDENGELEVRLASVLGFPYPRSENSEGFETGRVIEQIRAESIYPTGTKKITVFLQVPKLPTGTNTYTLRCTQ